MFRRFQAALPPLMNRLERVAGSAAAPLLIALAALAVMLSLYGRTAPVSLIRADDVQFTRSLVRFHASERNESTSFRWSEPEAALFAYGYEGHPLLVTLRLTAPRPAGSAAVQTRLSGTAGALGTITVAGDWRRYRLLLPSAAVGETVLRLSTDGFTPAADPRELGVALSSALLQPLGPLSPQPIRLSYLLAFPLLAWLLLRRAGSAALPAMLVGLLSVTLAGWAVSTPVSSGYWLPTLGWPWWPWLPVLLLMAWPAIAVQLARLRSRLTARPDVGWSCLALALAVLVGLRLGLTPWIGVPALVIATWCAAVSLIAAVPPADAAPTNEAPARFHGLAAPALLLVTALLLRLVQLDSLPFGLWRDEARHGLLALQIWNDATFRPIYVVAGADLPALLFYLMAPLLGSVGPSVSALRMVSALAGALTPLALYWAAAPLFGRRAALYAAAFIAWASWSLSMSRWAFPATLDHLLVLSAVGLIWRFARDRRPRAVAAMALAGLLGGLAVYTYHTGRMAVPALAVVALLRIGSDLGTQWRAALVARLRAAWPGLCAAALVGALTVAPLVSYILSDLAGFNRRVALVSVVTSNDLTLNAPLGHFALNLRDYALAYHLRGEENGRHHLPAVPLLDPYFGLLAAIGLVSALRQRNAAGLTVLALGAIYLIPGVLSDNAPHAMRALGTLAPAALLAGNALAALQSRLVQRLPRQLPTLLVSSLLGLSLLFNIWVYFGLMRVDPQVYNEFDLTETAIGRVVRAATQSSAEPLRTAEVYVPIRLRDREAVRFLSWGRPLKAYDGSAIDGNGPVLLVLAAEADAAQQAAALAALGPYGTALGPALPIPGTDQPTVLVFGRGIDAADLWAALGR